MPTGGLAQPAYFAGDLPTCCVIPNSAATTFLWLASLTSCSEFHLYSYVCGLRLVRPRRNPSDAGSADLRRWERGQRCSAVDWGQSQPTTAAVAPPQPTP